MSFILTALVFLTSLTASGTSSLESFTPPAEHPRILVRKADIPALRARMNHPEAKATLKRMERIARPLSDEEKASADWHSWRGMMKMRGVTMQSELDALDYLLYGNDKSGRRAVTAVLDTLKRAKFGRMNDMTRPCGEMMFVGALVYDWCHPLLTKAEKKEYVEQIVRCAGMMECGWPFKQGVYISGHFSEKMILRDFLAAGLAIYEEYPQMFEAVRKLLVGKYIPARNFMFRSGAYHQGTVYINARLTGDFSCLWLLDRAGAGQILEDSISSVIYDIIYRRIGEKYILPVGDGGFAKSYYSTISMLSSSYFKDPYIAYEYAKRPQADPHMLIFDLLCRNYDLKAKKPDDLPLTRYFGSPSGSMISRTGWGEDAAIVEMRMTERYVGNHQHLDAGTFYIYYKSSLALDSGFYIGYKGHYSDPHNLCYSKRTIAHNGLLIYDPDEQFGGKYGNDGGQRVPDYGSQCPDLEHLLTDDFLYGKTLSHWFGKDFSLLKCDITPAYRSSKASDVRRSFVYMDMHDSNRPAALVIHDHIVSTNPDFQKFFLLHTQNEPEIKGNVTTVCADGGMLRCTTLLPDSATLSTVGGPGKEFWVFGKNYTMVAKKSRDVPARIGRWRLEISPSKAAREDNFLNVIQIADEGAATPDAVRIDGKDIVGAAFGKRIALFNRKGGFFTDDVDFTIPSGVSGKMLVTDIAAGRWRLHSPDGKKTEFNVNETEGCILYSAATPGKYRIEKLKD